MSQALAPYMSQTLQKISEYLGITYNYGERGFYGEYPDLEDDAQVATDSLLAAWQLLLSLLETTGHDFLFSAAKIEYMDCIKSPLSAQPIYGEIYLYWPGRLSYYTSYLEAMYVPPSSPGEAVKAQGELMDFLSRIEKLLVNRAVFAWVPCNEEDVHLRIEGLLDCVYPDLQHKPVINKPIKNFVPDTSLQIARTLIEYKYIDSVEVAKRVCDEVLADVGGYASEDYDHFVFVIYETQRFMRADEWQAALDKSGSKTQLTAILLKGLVPDESDKRERESARKRMTRTLPKKANATNT